MWTEIIKDEFSSIISKYGFSAISVNDQVLLISKNIIIWCAASMECFEFWYAVPNRDKSVNIYSLDRILCKRKWKGHVGNADTRIFPSWKERVIDDIGIARRMLEEYGQDILSGDRNCVEEFYKRYCLEPSVLPEGHYIAVKLNKEIKKLNNKLWWKKLLHG